MSAYVVAIDQGTTSTRAMVFDGAMQAVATAQTEFTQHFPRSGWVEHDPEEIWKTTVWAVKTALEKAGVSAGDVAALGITNQRETVVVWDRATGKPVHNAIVWQDRRTAPTCERLRADGHEAVFAQKTGLLVDPYFAGTKVKYILDEVEGAREKAERGELAFGTIDSFLIWRLTGGVRHVTDATNASRTLLYNIRENAWDDELCAILDVPQAMLPDVLDCADTFGETDPELFGAAIPIRGVAGDQQAAVIGQACFTPGMIKSTYGTGCFALINTGEEFVPSQNRLLTTIAYRFGGRTTYALEGSIFIAGAAVQWLRDELGIIKAAEETGALAAQSDPHQSVYLVPAFVGLGAPWWDAEARGAIFGLTRASGAAEIARAALESVCYQTHDLLTAMYKDWASGDANTVLRVDGGMVASDWTMQCLADILDAPVDRPKMLETTVLGAAWLAGSAAGVWPGQDEFAKGWAIDRQFTPKLDAKTRQTKLAGWADAVKRTLS
ncbi:glycerol kinase GlpK [Pelagibacterium xiamenense]|uniref:glycerol kinase GlpK n=1 Tax=Pelagibacterium xiamenense TaxID=2901140 RepID=UPI001E5515E2|nr:glycerol kinase GlpK [Pelagibacterium xiamenense]